MITSVLSLARLSVDQIGGLALVALFYWFRFNSLKGTRSYTTAALYCSGVICFIVPFATVYVLVVAWLKSPIIAVWIIIGIWLFPWLPRKWRDFCHDLARIPNDALRLKDTLSAVSFELQKEDIPVVERKLARLGYKVDDFKAAQTTIIQGRYLKLAGMIHNLEKWEKDNPVFIQRNWETYSSMLQEFDMLSFKMIHTVKSVTKINSTIIQQASRSPAHSDDWETFTTLASSVKSDSLPKLQSATQAAMGTMLEDLRKDMDFFLELVLLFIARGVLYSHYTLSGRRTALERMGFKLGIGRTAPSIFPALLSAVFIVLLCSIAWFSIIKISVTGDAAIAYPKIITVQSINLLVNFLLIFHLKQRYAFANANASGGMPVLFILTVGFAAVLLALPIRVAFEYFQFRNLIHDEPISTFIGLSMHSLPWSLLPWVTGAVTALLAQDSMWSTIASPRQKQILDGLVFGGGQVLAILILWFIHQSKIFSVEGMDRFPIGFALPASFGIGFLMGYLVLGRIRDGFSLWQTRSRTTRPRTVTIISEPVESGPSLALPPFFRLKRWIDIVSSLVLIVLFFPFLLLAGVLVLLDVGAPIFFRQERLGWKGRSFLIYKFRTLRAPFDSAGNPTLGSRQPSVISRFLRVTRVDELPQLLNVLFGEMSLIGPRPLLPENRPANTSIRLSVRPGISGWAQVNGAKLVTEEEKEKMDEWYVRNASLWLDLRIIMMTIKVILRGGVSSQETLVDKEQVQRKNDRFELGLRAKGALREHM
jgi:lipopolysaccharide/colanic/teichoic acid biosynthesis glycosyltransferase